MRKWLSFLTFVIALLALSLPASAASVYQIDPVHTSITFSVRHLVISNVKGRFTKFKGTITLDENDLTHSNVDVTIDAASINTGNEKRDKDLRSENFLDVKKYPTITFKSTKIEKTGENTYRLIGDLTIHGVTREVEIPVTLHGIIKDPWGYQRLGAHAKVTLNRQDFGISWNKTLEGGGLVVGNDVQVDINLEAVKLKP